LKMCSPMKAAERKSRKILISCEFCVLCYGKEELLHARWAERQVELPPAAEAPPKPHNRQFIDSADEIYMCQLSQPESPHTRARSVFDISGGVTCAGKSWPGGGMGRFFTCLFSEIIHNSVCAGCIRNNRTRRAALCIKV
jgi:hypothetical protein